MVIRITHYAEQPQKKVLLITPPIPSEVNGVFSIGRSSGLAFYKGFFLPSFPVAIKIPICFTAAGPHRILTCFPFNAIIYNPYQPYLVFLIFLSYYSSWKKATISFLIFTHSFCYCIMNTSSIYENNKTIISNRG